MGYEPTTVAVPEQYEKVAICDLEGTLTASDLVWVALGEAQEVSWQKSKALYDQFSDGAFTQEVYRERIVDRWHDANEPPTRERLERVMDEHLEMDPAADRFVETLQSEGFYTMIASGAPDSYSEQAVELLDIDTAQGTDVSMIWAVYDDADVLERFDFSQYKSNKEAIIHDLRDRPHVNEVIAVGNSGNDIGMVEAADTAYMVPSDDRMQYEELETTIPHLTVAPLEEIADYLEDGKR